MTGAATDMTCRMTSNGLYYCTALGDGSSHRPWHLDEISECGARLRVDAPEQVPERFTLLLKGDVVKVRRCQVIWRSSSHIGVEFTQAEPAGFGERA
jgi:hypothetical protein